MWFQLNVVKPETLRLDPALCVSGVGEGAMDKDDPRD